MHNKLSWTSLMGGAHGAYFLNKCVISALLGKVNSGALMK